MQLRRAIDQFMDGYFATCERSPRTITAYRSDLDQFAEHQPRRQRLEEITPEILEQWAVELRKRNLTPASLRRKFAVLKIFFNYWVRKRALDRSPLWQLRLDFGRDRKLIRTLTPDEMRRLLKQAARELGKLPKKFYPVNSRKFLALRNLAIIELLFSTGMRVGEAAALRVEDVNQEQSTILIRGKGGKQRLAFLTEKRCIEIFECYLKQRQQLEATPEALFLNSLANSLSTQGISAILRKTAQDAGLQTRVTPHMLRHTAATFLLHNGADLRIVQEFLGHASVATTQRYTHVTRLQMVAALREVWPAAHLRRER